MSVRNKILIVDDAAVDRIALRKILGDTYEVVEADNAEPNWCGVT